MAEQQNPVSRLRALIADRVSAQTAGSAGMAMPGSSTAVPLTGGFVGAAQPLADVARLSARLRGEAIPAHRLAQRREAASREELVAAAETFGALLSVMERRLHEIKADDLPAILVLDDGSSVIVERYMDGHEAVITRGGSPTTMTLEDLGQRYSGTALFVRAGETTTGATIDATFGDEGARNAKPQNKSLMEKVARLTLTESRPLLTQLIIAGIVSNLLTIALPLFSMAVYDRVVPHQAVETLWALVIGVMIALIIDLGLRWVKLNLQDAVAVSASVTLQSRLYRRIIEARMVEMPRTAGGLTGALREIDQLCQSVPAVAVSLAVDVPFFIAVLILMGVLGGPLVIAPIVGVMLLIGVHWVAHVRAHKANIESSRLSGYQSNVLTETVETIEGVKATGAEGRQMRRWEDISDIAAHTSHRLRLWQGFANQATLIITQAVVVAVVVSGVYSIGAGLMTIGALTACTMLVGRAMSPIGSLVSQVFKLMHLRDSSAPVDKLLGLQAERVGDTGRSPDGKLNLAIDFKGVGFTFPSETLPALTGVTLSIKPGERVAIIGRTGSGKSTMLKLLPRFYEPTEGRMLIDGHDALQYDPAALRRSIAFMRQDPLLFDDTLRANIVFGLDVVDEESFERAVVLSGVREFAARHPQGYGLRVGPRGERLSGGERQAVWLARTLLADARMILLDEPTAAMDSTLEQQVIRDLKRALGDRTLVVATHRAAVLELVDRVIWLENGRVVADGPKAEVMKSLSGKAA